MKVLTEGHKYELDSMEHTNPQTLQFIEKSIISKPITEYVTDFKLFDRLETVHDGTTNEEVLRMLIDRMQYLQGKAACRENAIVITKLEEALMWLEKRTADRKARNVEGTPAK